MQFLKLRKCFIAFIVFAFLAIPIFTVSADDGLEFDPDNWVIKTVTDGDLTVTCRAYENIVYVSNPVDTVYQSMNIYIPEGYENSRTAPIFFPNGVGGYMPAKPAVIDQSGGMFWDTRPHTMLVALSKGYIVAAPGCRGSTLVDGKGVYYGKAPTGIVDLKAAVRYLRYNDAVMPGDAERIISNGTSAGGAMSSLLGATGNSKDYEPYLIAIGAADERDNVFAASCYCPITNLENSDMAYEWQFNGIFEYTGFGPIGPGGTLTEEQIVFSDILKPMFSAYLNRLRLWTNKYKNTKYYKPWEKKSCRYGNKKTVLLSLDEYGEGNFNEYVKSFVIASVQKALDDGQDLSGPEFGWITINNGIVNDVHLFGYSLYAKRMKAVPAFDSAGNPECDLFGDEDSNKQHFTRFSYERIGGLDLADAQIIKMMNPMDYIDARGAKIAKHWRIRHGLIDTSTSIAIPIILVTKLRNAGCNVDFGFPWGQEHGGDYDLDELFDWMDNICNTKP